MNGALQGCVEVVVEQAAQLAMWVGLADNDEVLEVESGDHHTDAEYRGAIGP